MSSPTQQQTSTPDYLNILGLDRAPFLDQIDDHFFYADPALIQRLDLLQHLTRFGDMLLGITGPIGSGKTTLLRQFLLRGNNTWRSCLVQGGQVKQSGELLARLADCFGQDMTATPERIRADLTRYCEALQHNSQLAVIVIDDAHLLPDPALKTLLDLGGDARQTLKLVRILLFGEPGLEQKLINAGLHSPQQPLLHSLEMPRFDEHQSAAYLMYRLAVAGFSGDSPFSLTEIRALHKTAEGLPGRLNVLAHETLIERATRIATRKKAGPVSMPPPGTVAPRRRLPAVLIGLGGLLSLGLIGWYLLQSDVLQERLGDRLADLEPSSAPAELGDIPQAERPLHGLTGPELRKILDSYPENEQPTDLKTDNGIKGSDSTTSEAPVPAPIADTPEHLTAPEAVASAQPATQEAAPAAEPGKDNGSPAPSVTASQPTAPASAPPAQVATGSAPGAAAPTPTPERTPEESAPEAVTPKATQQAAPQMPPEPREQPENIEKTIAKSQEPQASQAPATPSPVSTGLDLQDETWLLQRPGNHFTLQLLGVRSEASLHDYLKHKNIPGPVAYFHTLYKGGDWFVLVQGDYSDITEARAAVSTLPAAVRKAKPWPRSFAGVQADIHKPAP